MARSGRLLGAERPGFGNRSELFETIPTRVNDSHFFWQEDLCGFFGASPCCEGSSGSLALFRRYSGYSHRE